MISMVSSVSGSSEMAKKVIGSVRAVHDWYSMEVRACGISSPSVSLSGSFSQLGTNLTIGLHGPGSSGERRISNLLPKKNSD